ncbi:MAG: glycosyltransferase [Bryobacteraceae bacterium]
MAWCDQWLLGCLIPLALWTLASGLDDLFILFVWCLPRRKRPKPTSAALARTPERRIAIFVPLWREDRVIGQMLQRTLSAVCYEKYDIFAGVYPNDEATASAVREVAARWPRLHVATVPHEGPTSKGDCLNAIYNDMTAWEAARGVRFEIILTHDAEDLVYADSLRLINWFSRDYEMVQIPVLPLPTPFREFTHGVYCDEFAEFQLKDLVVRRLLGGFLPANGVGTGFERDALEALAAARGGCCSTLRASPKIMKPVTGCTSSATGRCSCRSRSTARVLRRRASSFRGAGRRRYASVAGGSRASCCRGGSAMAGAARRGGCTGSGGIGRELWEISYRRCRTCCFWRACGAGGSWRRRRRRWLGYVPSRCWSRPLTF